MQAAEEQRVRDEEARREHEEYLKLKEQFTVDAEGVDVLEQADVRSCTNTLLLEKIEVILTLFTRSELSGRRSITYAI